MNILLIISHSYLFCVICAQTVGQYDNYQFYEIFIENQQQLEMFRFMESHPDGVSKPKISLHTNYSFINQCIQTI